MLETYNALSLDEYAMYLRKSREDRDKEKHGGEDTLKRHREILTDHAARKGLYIAKTYEEVVSGETIKDRPEMQQLIKDCYAGKYRGILVVEVSRLSRGNQGDAQTILDCLKFANNNKGLLVVTPTKVYDIAHNPDDEEYMEFELFMSRREFKMINKRLDRGRKQAIVEGQFMGSYRPYGYDILKTRAYRTLVPNPEEAPIVKNIFEWRVKERLTPGKIAKRLDSMGVPTYTGTPEWSIDTVKTILTNPVYIGKVRWNDRMQVKTMVDGQLVTSRPRSNHTEQYMLYDGKHKAHALVDEETFYAASGSFRSDKTKANYKLQNPIAGLLVCQKCGRAIGYQGYNKRETTEPRYIHAPSQLCKVKSALMQDVINAVVRSLEMYIEDFQCQIDNLPDVDENSILDQMEAMRKEIRKYETRLSKLFDAWEDGTITNNEFVQRKAVNTDKIESIKAQMEILEESIPEKEEYQEMILGLSDALAALLDPDLDADVKNAYLKGIIEKIEYSRENTEEFILDVYLR